MTLIRNYFRILYRLALINNHSNKCAYLISGSKCSYLHTCLYIFSCVIGSSTWKWKVQLGKLYQEHWSSKLYREHWSSSSYSGHKLHWHGIFHGIGNNKKTFSKLQRHLFSVSPKEAYTIRLGVGGSFNQKVTAKNFSCTTVGDVKQVLESTHELGGRWCFAETRTFHSMQWNGNLDLSESNPSAMAGGVHAHHPISQNKIKN